MGTRSLLAPWVSAAAWAAPFVPKKKRRLRPEQGRTTSEESQEQQRHIPCLAARDATKQGQLSTRQEPLEGAATCSPETLNKLNRVLIQLCLARQQRGGMAEGSRSLRNPRDWVLNSITGTEPTATAAPSLPLSPHTTLPQFVPLDTG